MSDIQKLSVIEQFNSSLRVKMMNGVLYIRNGVQALVM
jgi:hypothetical protein